MEALIPPPLVVPPLSIAPPPLTLLLPLTKLVLRVVVAPLGAITPLMMEK
jgi:hypothetical protein